MNGGSGGIVVLIIIGIVLNMVIKAMRTKPKQPAQRQAPRPNPGQNAERPLDERPHADLGQIVERPIADEPRPQAPRTPLAPQLAPRVGDVRPVAEERDLTQGVSLEGISSEGPTLEGQSSEGKARGTMPERLGPAGVWTPDERHIAGWFRGRGMVRGIIMSEILSPPVSRRR